LRIKLHY